MTLKGTCFAAAVVASFIISAAHAEDPNRTNGIMGFHPYVSLGSRCDGIDSRLAGIPVPLGAGMPNCSASGQDMDAGPNRKPLLLIFDAGTGRITGTRPY